jgi:hypothetical protein
LGRIRHDHRGFLHGQFGRFPRPGSTQN